MKKILIVAGLVAVLLVGWYVSQLRETDTPEVGGYQWQMTELGESTTIPGMPRTNVALAYEGETYPVGEYDGACFVMNGSGWTLLEDEVSGVICWWAGGGKEIGIFEEDNSLVVKEGELDEGSAEIPGFRGDWKTLFTLEKVPKTEEE